MAVARKRQKMKRMQISVSPEQFEKAKRIAARRSVSMSQVCRDGIDCVDQRDEEEDQEYFDRMWSIVGIVKGADPNASANHDDILYGSGASHPDE
jgi:hypothetical protein